MDSRQTSGGPATQAASAPAESPPKSPGVRKTHALTRTVDAGHGRSPAAQDAIYGDAAGEKPVTAKVRSKFDN